MKKLAAKICESRRVEFPGAHSYPLFGEEDTPVPGCLCMLNIFHNERYPEPFGLHGDNEGFYVISGTGMFSAGGEEYELTPGCCMLAPAGVPHALRKTGAQDLKVFIYHFPK